MSWFFEGSAGVSFSRNITIPGIDVATTHCYPEARNLSLIQGALWVADHRQVAHAGGKPVILEEFGSLRYAIQLFEISFSEALYDNTSGILPWQFIYDDRPDNDGYAFSCPGDIIRPFHTRSRNHCPFNWTLIIVWGSTFQE